MCRESLRDMKIAVIRNDDVMNWEVISCTGDPRDGTLEQSKKRA